MSDLVPNLRGSGSDSVRVGEDPRRAAGRVGETRPISAPLTARRVATGRGKAEESKGGGDPAGKASSGWDRGRKREENPRVSPSVFRRTGESGGRRSRVEEVGTEGSRSQAAVRHGGGRIDDGEESGFTGVERKIFEEILELNENVDLNANSVKSALFIPVRENFRKLPSRSIFRVHPPCEVGISIRVLICSEKTKIPLQVKMTKMPSKEWKVGFYISTPLKRILSPKFK